MSKFPQVLHNDYILHCRRLKGDREMSFYHLVTVNGLDFLINLQFTELVYLFPFYDLPIP